MNLKRLISEEVRRAVSARNDKGGNTPGSTRFRVNEAYGDDFEGPGLIVTGHTTLDNNNIKDVIEDHGFTGYWNAKEGYWFFPEEIDMLDELESELDVLFATYDVNARFESQEQ